MERSKKHKVHISTTQEVSESRENYTKVVMQKQMLLPYNNNNNSKKKQQDLKSEKEIEIQDHQTTASITQEQSSSRYAPRSLFFTYFLANVPFILFSAIHEIGTFKNHRYGTW